MSRFSAGSALWRGYRLAAAWPALLTLLSVAASPGGIGPFDARTGEQLVGIELVMPAWESIFEPFLAPFYIVADAGDYRSTAVSLVGWLFVFCFSARTLLSRPATVGGAIGLWRSLTFAVGACSLLLLYYFFAALVPLPAWTLKTDDPSLIVADIHSHTTGSHDAFVPPLQNVTMHHARGYNVVAWTDHYSSRWSTIAQQQAATKTSDVILGAEISTKIDRRHYYLILLGIDPNFFVATSLQRLHDHPTLRAFIDDVHSHHGAVIVVNLNLQASDVTSLAEDGIDGFEIANFGHPRISSETRAALLELQRTNHIALLADSDWHGWSGFFRTWNIIAADGQKRRGIQAIDALRLREANRVIPAVSRMFDDPSAAGRIFSAFTETVRYAQQLSPLRVLSWWIWAGGLCWLAINLKESRYSLLGTFATLGGVVLGASIALRGVQLIIIGLFSATFPYPSLLGSLALTIGIAAVIIAWTNKATIHQAKNIPAFRSAKISN